MRLEDIPLLLGALMALVGLAFIWDAVTPDTGRWQSPERRRRPRAERDRLGESAVGLGVLCLAAALAGRDTWRYGTVAVLAGAILLLTGALLNLAFLREVLLFSGPARRQPGREPREPDAALRHAAGEAPAAAGTPAGAAGASADADALSYPHEPSRTAPHPRDDHPRRAP